MGIYAMMTGDTVETLIVCDDKQVTEEVLRCVLIEVDPENPIGPGWTYDSVNDVFVASPEPEPVDE